MAPEEPRAGNLLAAARRAAPAQCGGQQRRARNWSRASEPAASCVTSDASLLLAGRRASARFGGNCVSFCKQNMGARSSRRLVARAERRREARSERLAGEGARYLHRDPLRAEVRMFAKLEPVCIGVARASFAPASDKSVADCSWRRLRRLRRPVGGGRPVERELAAAAPGRLAGRPRLSCAKPTPREESGFGSIVPLAADERLARRSAIERRRRLRRLQQQQQLRGGRKTSGVWAKLAPPPSERWMGEA